MFKSPVHGIGEWRGRRMKTHWILLKSTMYLDGAVLPEDAYTCFHCQKRVLVSSGAGPPLRECNVCHWWGADTDVSKPPDVLVARSRRAVSL